MSAHCNQCGADLVYGQWPEMFCQACERLEVIDLWGYALHQIANRKAVERNPDGVDQGAETMQLIAREALEATPRYTHRITEGE